MRGAEADPANAGETHRFSSIAPAFHIIVLVSGELHPCNLSWPFFARHEQGLSETTITISATLPGYFQIRVIASGHVSKANNGQGAGGGPNEDNVTGLLVRSTASNWRTGSLLAVDAGIHLAAIIRILEEHLPQATSRSTNHSSAIGLGEASIAVTTRSGLGSLGDEAANPKIVLSSGPFASLELPYDSAKANGAYVIRQMISTYLITHPHLDHISGFAINTAALQQTVQPKRVAALPSTIDALKTHIFNDVIWPNLTNENGGVGLVSFLRLVDSGKNALNDESSCGYIEVCDGISVSCWSVSHGQCKAKNTANTSSTGAKENFDPITTPRGSSRIGSSLVNPKDLHPVDRVSSGNKINAIDSAAFFLRDHSTGREALIFGDVEPDSLSLAPRTTLVWTEAAKRIVLGTLTGILIECSFEDSQPDEMLFGHLCPRHLVAELQCLAEKVRSLRTIEEVSPQRKRKRRSLGIKPFESHEVGIYQTRNPNKARRSLIGNTRSTNQIIEKPLLAKEEFRENVLASDEEANKTASSKNLVSTTCGDTGSYWSTAAKGFAHPLKGLKVFIIHVKDILNDGPEVSETILAQLRQHEKVFQLGCTFTISKAGTSIWL